MRSAPVRPPITGAQRGVPLFAGARPSAVLVALHDGPPGAEVILTRRSWALRNHRGEISFPGGRSTRTRPRSGPRCARHTRRWGSKPVAGRGRRTAPDVGHRGQPQPHRPRGRAAAGRAAADRRRPRSSASSTCRWRSSPTRACSTRSGGGRPRSSGPSSSSSSTTRRSGGRRRGCWSTCSRSRSARSPGGPARGRVSSTARSPCEPPRPRTSHGSSTRARTCSSSATRSCPCRTSRADAVCWRAADGRVRAAGNERHFLVAWTESGELFGAVSLRPERRDGRGPRSATGWNGSPSAGRGPSRASPCASGGSPVEVRPTCGAPVPNLIRQRARSPRHWSRPAATPCSGTARDLAPAAARPCATARCSLPTAAGAQAASTWRRSRRAAADARTAANERPSATDRVKSARSAGVGGGDHGVRGVVAAPKGEADEVERVRGHELEPVVGRHPPGELLGQATWSRIMAWIGADAVDAQREPQLERAEAPAEGDLPVAVVDDRAGLAGRGPEVLGQDRQRAEQRGPVGHPEQVAVEVHAHPLVRVGAVGVGLVEAGVDPAQLGAQRGHAAHAPRRRAARRPRAGRSRRSRGPGRRPWSRWCPRWRRRRRAGARRRGPRRWRPPARRAAWRSRRRASTRRRLSVPMPAMRTPFSMDEWACEVV